jgi:hypothetical protein
MATKRRRRRSRGEVNVDDIGTNSRSGIELIR